MQDSRILAQGTRDIPDYTGNLEHARELAKRVQDFYHTRGYKKVRAWVEPLHTPSSDNKVYGIRSNIVFDVSKLNQ